MQTVRWVGVTPPHPSPLPRGERGLFAGSGWAGGHPHPSPLPSRERGSFCRLRMNVGSPSPQPSPTRGEGVFLPAQDAWGATLTPTLSHRGRGVFLPAQDAWGATLTPALSHRGRGDSPWGTYGRGDQAGEGSPAPVSERNHGISAASSGHRNSNPASSAYFLSRSSRSPMW